MAALDVDFVRSGFPAFEVADTPRWVHFENAGGTYACRPVIESLTEFFTATKLQPYYPGGPSQRAGEAMDRAKRLVPAMLGAPLDSVMLGPSTSQNTYVLAQALRGGLRSGDEFVVTDQDHEANIGVWRRLEADGVVIREWAVDPETGLLDIADLDALLGERTAWVAVTHASNVIATVNPIREIADRCHAAGAKLIVDGVAAAPHVYADVNELDCDVYLFSAYKTFGPHVGVMYVRPAVLADLENQGHFFNAEHLAMRLVPAGPDHAEVAACAGMVDHLRTVHHHHGGSSSDSDAEAVRSAYRLFHDHERSLIVRLVDGLRDRDGVTVYGDDEHRVASSVSFVSARRPSAEINRGLAGAGIIGGSGSFYARRLVEALGHDPVDGVVRLSLAHYSTSAEVDRALDALDDLL